MTLEMILIALALGILTGFLVVGVMKGQLKTVCSQPTANSYVRSGSLQLTFRSDRYLYSHVTRTPRPKNNSRSNR